MIRLLILAMALLGSVTTYSETLIEGAMDHAVKVDQKEMTRLKNMREVSEQLSDELKKLKQQLAQLESDTETLTEAFSQNEVALAEMEKKLALQIGSLGDVFSVARQQAQTLVDDVDGKPLGWLHKEEASAIYALINQKGPLELEQLKHLFDVYSKFIQSTSKWELGQLEVVDANGVIEDKEAVSIGAYAVLTDTDYIDLRSSPYRPFTISHSSNFTQIQQGPASTQYTVLIDPTLGSLFANETVTITLKDRFDSAGVIGKIIAALFISGIAISLFRGVRLSKERLGISRQLNTRNQSSNNALGRMLAIYHSQSGWNVEALELRLLETLVDEQVRLEKGLSMLKLLAALAPMLGLLGTVIGMIETFQSMTDVGSDRASMMASGISTALVTTVLGLISAMPLLLAHNHLSTQAESIRQILEKQGLALVAELAEKTSKRSQNVSN